MNNKILLAVSAATLSVTSYTAVVSAATVSADADANVIQALVITQTQGMNFGDISENGGGTVTLNLDGTRSAGAGTEVLPGGGNVQGIYNISGGNGKAYTLTFPTTATVTNGGDTMTVDNFNDDADGTSLPAGEDFNLGADIGIVGGQATGAYSGTYTITVNYN